jgi:hypothetical protein
MAGIIKLNYDHKTLASVVISSIMIINVMPPNMVEIEKSAQKTE